MKTVEQLIFEKRFKDAEFDPNDYNDWAKENEYEAYTLCLAVAKQLQQHLVMQAEGSDGAKGATVGQRSVDTNAEAQAVTHGICKERNCNKPATKDYNGHEHWVCDYHYDKLNDEFDEEYR